MHLRRGLSRISQYLKEILPIVEGVPSLEVLEVGTPEFRSRYQSRFKESALGGAAKSYDALLVIKSAIERCGESRAEIQRCLPGPDLVDVGIAVRFNSSREIADKTPCTKIMMVKDGKFYELNSRFESGTEFNF